MVGRNRPVVEMNMIEGVRYGVEVGGTVVLCDWPTQQFVVVRPPALAVRSTSVAHHNRTRYLSKLVPAV